MSTVQEMALVLTYTRVKKSYATFSASIPKVQIKIILVKLKLDNTSHRKKGEMKCSHYANIHERGNCWCKCKHTHVLCNSADRWVCMWIDKKRELRSLTSNTLSCGASVITFKATKKIKILSLQTFTFWQYLWSIDTCYPQRKWIFAICRHCLVAI